MKAKPFKLVTRQQRYKPNLSRRKSWWTAFAQDGSRTEFSRAVQQHHLERETSEAERRAFEQTSPWIGYWRRKQA